MTTTDSEQAPAQRHGGPACCERAQLSSGPAFAALRWVNPVSFVELTPGDTVLIIGPGGERETLIAAARVGSIGRVIDVQLTDPAFERTLSTFTASGVDNVEVRRGVAARLPASDRSVDWVIANCVIESVADQPGVFAEIGRVLKPGGRVCVADVFAEPGAGIRLSDVLPGSCLADAGSEGRYITGLRACGLTDITVGGRYVYERDQLGDLGAATARLAEQLAGCVWSAWFSARKPQAHETTRQSP